MQSFRPPAQIGGPIRTVGPTLDQTGLYGRIAFTFRVEHRVPSRRKCLAVCARRPCLERFLHIVEEIHTLLPRRPLRFVRTPADLDKLLPCGVGEISLACMERR